MESKKGIMNYWKQAVIGLGVLIAFIFIVITIIFSSSNRAIGFEEQVKSSQSSVQVQEKRRADLIVNLVDTVQSYNKFEQETLAKIIDARSKANAGNVDEAQLIIQAVVEAYPELKSNENYKYLMTELSTTENLIATYRDAYNNRTKEYNRYVKKFPTKIFLDMSGYDVQDFKYLEYKGLEDSPKNLFNE